MAPCPPPPAPAIPRHPVLFPHPSPPMVGFLCGRGHCLLQSRGPTLFLTASQLPRILPCPPPTHPCHELPLGSPSITCTHCHRRRIHFQGGRPGSIQLLGHKKGYAIRRTRPDRPGRRPPPHRGSTRLAHSQARHRQPPRGKPPPAPGSGVITARCLAPRARSDTQRPSEKRRTSGPPGQGWGDSEPKQLDPGGLGQTLSFTK